MLNCRSHSQTKHQHPAMNSVEIVPELELEGELEPTDGIDKIHSILPDQPPLLHREFVDVEPRKEVEERDVIRVMQWNCLAQGLAVACLEEKIMSIQEEPN